MKKYGYAVSEKVTEIPSLPTPAQIDSVLGAPLRGHGGVEYRRDERPYRQYDCRYARLARGDWREGTFVEREHIYLRVWSGSLPEWIPATTAAFDSLKTCK